MIKLLFFLLEVHSYCGTIQNISEYSQIDIEANSHFSIGIWTKFQTFGYSWETRWFVIKVVNQLDDPVLQLVIDYDDDSFQHTWSYTDGEGQVEQQQFVIHFKNDFGVYEGAWFLNYMSYDSQNILFYLWPYGADIKFIQNIHVQSQMQLNDLQFKASSEPNFKGQLSRIIDNVYLFSTLDLIDYVNSCSILQCSEQMQNIETSRYFSKNESSYFDLAYEVHLKQQYSIGQWFKLELENIESIAFVLIFGVVARGMFLYDDFYGIHVDYQVFKLNLNYNLFDPSTNSFQISTYSYITPIIGHQRERFPLNIQIQNKAILQNWIYFEYQHFELNSQVYFYFSLDQSELKSQFNQPIYHFSDLYGDIVYQFKRDERRNQLFVGQVKYVTFYDCFIPQNNGRAFINIK